MTSKFFIFLCIVIILGGLDGLRVVNEKAMLLEIRESIKSNGEKITYLDDKIFALTQKIEAVERNLKELGFEGSQTGIASWYGNFEHGRITASGEIFDREGQTAAHKTARFGTWALVENLLNGLKTIVRINDRMPDHPGRVIDLSPNGAKDLGMIHAGIVPVRIRWIARDVPIARPGTGD